MRATLDALASSEGVDGEALGVFGYSFGAWVGLGSGCRDTRVKALAGAAPPLAVYPVDDLNCCHKPKFFIVGDSDAYCPRPAFEGWFDGLPAPKQSAVLSGADHFLGGREAEAARAVAAFFDGCLRERD